MAENDCAKNDWQLAQINKNGWAQSCWQLSQKKDKKWPTMKKKIFMIPHSLKHALVARFLTPGFTSSQSVQVESSLPALVMLLWPLGQRNIVQHASSAQHQIRNKTSEEMTLVMMMDRGEGTWIGERVADSKWQGREQSSPLVHVCFPVEGNWDLIKKPYSEGHA